MELSVSGHLAARYVTHHGSLRHGIPPQEITEPDEIERLQVLLAQYRAACLSRPFANRILLSLNLGATIYGVPAERLRLAKRRFACQRQKLMTFAFVVGHGEHSFKAIGRVFGRHHATVMHAVLKYEEAMRELIG